MTRDELRNKLNEERGSMTGLCSTELALDVCNMVANECSAPMFAGNDITETEVGHFAISFEAREFNGWLREYVATDMSFYMTERVSRLLEYFGINHTVWYAYKGVRQKDFRHISLPMSRIREEYPYLWRTWIGEPIYSEETSVA